MATDLIVKDTLFIGGEWVKPAGTETIDVISPTTEQVIARVPDGTAADIDRAVAAAREAFDHGPWPRMSPAERADVMAALSLQIQTRMQEFADTITAENGCPVSWGVMGQVFAATMALDFFESHVRTMAFEEERTGLMGPAIVRKEPVGVVGAIVPWNVPLFVTMLKLAPALAAGCTVVLKPAPETPVDAYMLAECLTAAGLPKGVVNIVAAGREAGERLVVHPDVDKISFTGSTAAGRHIATLCGERLRRVTLELGGKSAAIILDDADIATSVAGLVPAGMMNNGQACVAQTRILASRNKYDEVVDAMVEAVRALKVGDPMDAATEIGPLVAQRQRDRVMSYLDLGQKEGAKVATGGGRPAGIDKGWFVEPTVFVNVDNQMKIAQEEIFGPVVAVIPYDDVEDAIAIANDSDYGLSGSVWSADAGAALDVARQVRTGTLSINGFILDFNCPFGGFKSSGLGRELGAEGLGAYLEYKTISFPGAAALP
ncbi:MAG TPA: aldehyde dehydrogenase [Acidimicrobiales bacterium]|nr:aldehyde dehydrogenase [Acidimicrobiales bacterium]